MISLLSKNTVIRPYKLSLLKILIVKKEYFAVCLIALTDILIKRVKRVIFLQNLHFAIFFKILFFFTKDGYKGLFYQIFCVKFRYTQINC